MPNTTNPMDLILKEEKEKVISDILLDLDKRERVVLVLYYGLEGRTPRTHKEVGKMLNVTPSRAQQMHWGAINRLRHPCRIGMLREIYYRP